VVNEPTDGRKAYGDIAPALGEYTDKVLFGEVWDDPGSPSPTAASSPLPRSSPCTVRTSYPSISSGRSRTLCRRTS
jgi:hypothetical protein